MRPTSFALLGLVCFAATALAHPPAGHVALRAGRTFDGVRWHQGVTVVLHGDRIQELRRDGSVPGGATLIDMPDAVLTPGLIDLDSSMGLAEGRDEFHEALSPDLRVADAFAPEAEELEAFRRSGVTSAWLSPGPTGVLGGRGAVVQPGAPGQPGRFLAADWGATGSLAAAARLGGREPTSLPHQAQMLEAALADAGAGPSRVRVDDSASVARGARLSSALLVGRPEDDASLQELGTVRGLVVSGLSPSAAEIALRAPARLDEQGVVLGFGSDTSPLGPAAIRLAAARAVLSGLSPTTALRALTGSAAGLAALPGARGTITRGAAADLVIWTGDPVEPASRPLRVWVGGLEVLHED